MQQNREEWYDKSVLHLDTEKGHTYRGLIIHWHSSGTALTRYDKSIADRTEGCVCWHFFYIDIQTLISQSSRSAGWGANLKIHILLGASNPHFHPLTCHCHNKTSPSTTFITEHISCFHSEAESSAVLICTAFLVVSHMEATQAGEKMRGVRGNLLREGSHMEGI